MIRVLVLLAATQLVVHGQQPMTFQYFYDEIGQLTKVVDSTGIVIEYIYDAAGNMLEIKRSSLAAGTLSILSFTPQRGTTGSLVTIVGLGFSATPNGNLVRFGGVLVPVLSASPTQIVVQLPVGAASGPVSVTVGPQTATSTTTFSVVPVPVITSVFPKSALAGTTVTNLRVTGFNLTNTTFALTPTLLPAAGTMSGIVANQAGTEATMTLTIRADVGLQFVVIGTSSFGTSDSFPSPEKILTIYNLAPGADEDRDGLTNAEEVARGTDPTKADTDGDGYIDGVEAALGSDPLNPASVPNPAPGPREAISLYTSVLNGVPPVPLPTTSAREAVSLYTSVLNGIPPIPLPQTSAREVVSLYASIFNGIPPVPLPASSAREAISLYVSVLNGIPPVPLPTTTARESIGPLVSVLNATPISGTTSQDSFGRTLLHQTVGAMISRLRQGTAQDYGPDSDGDGVPDKLEELIHSDSTKTDSDSDGFPDGLELALGSNPLEPLSVPVVQRTLEVFSPIISVANTSARIALADKNLRRRSQ